MSKKNVRSTKNRIVTAAWKLFYELGYENTTIDDIIAESQTSKGSFYHYFEGKDALLGSLALLFDEKYEELSQKIDLEKDNCFDLLLYLNVELLDMIEHQIDLDLLTLLYSTQLTTKGEKNLLDHDRVYYRLLRKIILSGQTKGEITNSMPATEIVRLYAMCERALIYDWCLYKGAYSLTDYAKRTMPLFLEQLRVK